MRWLLMKILFDFVSINSTISKVESIWRIRLTRILIKFERRLIFSKIKSYWSYPKISFSNMEK